MARRGDRLGRAVEKVLESQNCSGCGGCATLFDGLSMERDDSGFLRPLRTEAGTTTRAQARRFRSVCPGVTVTAPRPPQTTRDEILGPYVGIWRASATDPEIRRSGSSGGVLTALARFAVEIGESTSTTAVGADSDNARQTVPLRLMTRQDALDAAGSRYAPVAVLSEPSAWDPDGTTVVKPCEASALRAARPEGARPLILSFFCAGTPSQAATDRMLSRLDVQPDARLASLRYRGDGWPGRFSATTSAGRTVSASYEQSWGEVLGRDLQWRCKVCADGVGESSDVTAGDLWDSDAQGYPTFVEGAGSSALITRTPRGHALVLRAIEAGIITAEPVTAAEVSSVQPLQVQRRRTLMGRLLGARLAGRSTPRFRGFGLLRLALRDPVETRRTLTGTLRRVRRPA